MSPSPITTPSGSTPSDPEELRRDIEETRGELAATINAVAYKADVKARAQDKAQELTARAAEKAQAAKARAQETTQQLRERAPQMAEAAKGRAGEKAQELLGQARGRVQEKPGTVAAAVGALLVVVALVIRRGRR